MLDGFILQILKCQKNPYENKTLIYATHLLLILYQNSSVEKQMAAKIKWLIEIMKTSQQKEQI